MILVIAAFAAIVPPAQADTIIPGDYNVTGAETWDVGGSPYIIQGHLNIASTGQLTITAGVEVRIAQDHLFRVKQRGRLIVQGTVSEPVKITSETGHFTGFLFEGNAHAQLSHCKVSQAGATAACGMLVGECKCKSWRILY